MEALYDNIRTRSPRRPAQLLGSFQWSAWACETCRLAGGNTADIFKRFAVPTEPLNNPAIKTWLERHFVERAE